MAGRPFTLADAAVAVAADMRQYDADLKKAETTGRASGSRLATALKSDFGRILGAGASLAFGLMTKGALELGNAQARYRAETGATAEEAERTGRVVNRVAGDNRMALESVNDIAIHVRRNMGLVGDEADAMTAKIAQFARVTKQDGAGAVSDLDDIMDAWGLQAADMGGLLDKLIVSGQKWGGSIAADQKALAAMAPQLKAFNLTVDDGIALLNLYKASGLDAAGIPRALNSAIQELDGRPLSEFVAELAAIEDPGERARRAIEVFGARAGAQLANAIKPGMDSLEAFGITAEESVGALDKSTEALDSTIPGRIQKFLSQVGAGLRQFGADLGPATTALASLGTLVASVGGGKVLAAGLKGIASLGGKLVFALGAQFATSEAIGAIANGISGGIGKVTNLPIVRAAAARVGSFLGTTVGKGVGVGLAATAGLAIGLWFLQEQDRHKAEVLAKAEALGAELARHIMDGAADAALLGDRENILKALTLKQTDEAYAVLEAALARVDAALAERGRVAHREGERMPLGLAEGIEEGAPKAISAASSLGRAVVGAMKDIGVAGFLRAGAASSLAYAAGIRDKRDAIKAALDTLRQDLKNAVKPAREIAKNTGRLIGETLIEGLASKDAAARTQAEGTRGIIEARLLELIAAGGKVGEKTLDELAEAMKSKDPDVRRQAERTKKLIDEALKAQPPRTPGEAISSDLASDISRGIGVVGRAAYNLGRTIFHNLMAGVHGTGSVGSSGGGGRARHQRDPDNMPTYETGINYVPADITAGLHEGEAVLNRQDAEAFRAGLRGAGSGGGDTYTNTWVMPEPTRDPWKVLDETARYVRWGRLRQEPSGG